MNAAQRRQAIMRCLNREPDAITASALAAMFSVSRQVIVQDIAIPVSYTHLGACGLIRSNAKNLTRS